LLSGRGNGGESKVASVLKTSGLAGCSAVRMVVITIGLAPNPRVLWRAFWGAVAVQGSRARRSKGGARGDFDFRWGLLWGLVSLDYLYGVCEFVELGGSGLQRQLLVNLSFGDRKRPFLDPLNSTVNHCDYLEQDIFMVICF
jgi:hypothetical protein